MKKKLKNRNIQINGNDVMLTDSKAKLDLGGIAKGFIADKMKAYFTVQKNHLRHHKSGWQCPHCR